MRFWKLIWLLCMLTLVAGCNEEILYSGLTEQEANEMVALMQRAGLPASKVSGKDASFSVSTESEQFANAVQLLQANGLPRPSFDNLGKVFQDQGFVTSNTAQRARYIHALSQEISHTISSIDGVILARVHLAVPERDPLSDVKVQSSASVFVKHRADVDLSSHVSQIKALVINGLENLPYENVTVALFEALPQSSLQAAPLLLPALNDTAQRAQSGSGALSNKMSLVPRIHPPEIPPKGLIVTGLLVLLAVLSGLFWTLRVRSRNRTAAQQRP